MKKIKAGFILSSSALSIKKKQIKYYLNFSDHDKKAPEVGDLVYGTISYIGFHKTLENQHGRIHHVDDGSKAIFVFGNRYAPDAYEGIIPDKLEKEVDLLARSGMVGNLISKNSNIADPSKVHIHGYVCDKEGKVINTRNFPLINIKKENKNKSKLILVVGSAMNSGKSYTAAACCWALANNGYSVNASKVTGTASLKDILLMEDNGAEKVSDFSYLGYPSTYLLDDEEMLDIYQKLEVGYGRGKDYWVVELADGILQKETAYLLSLPHVRERIHKLIFCGRDALGVIGGLKVLNAKFNLIPDVISGVFASSPLAIKETEEYTSINIMDSTKKRLDNLSSILI
jgi:hypothetical protein